VAGLVKLFGTLCTLVFSISLLVGKVDATGDFYRFCHLLSVIERLITSKISQMSKEIYVFSFFNRCYT